MIGANTFIEDLVNEHPELITPLAEIGIVCVACGEPVWGTLGDLILSKNINDPDEVYKNLNRIVRDKENGE